MKIEFLYFEDCPVYKSALSLLQQVLLETGKDISFKQIEITTQELAIQHRFLGSPFIRINGKDIEGREDVSEYGLKCRIYPETNSGIPSIAVLRKALQEAENRS
jgi:glutaredoxin